MTTEPITPPLTPPETGAPPVEAWNDPTFDFVELDEKAPQRLSRWFWLQWCALLAVGFGMLSVLSGGFDRTRDYGWTEAGVNKVLLFSKTEKLYALGLLAMAPLALFLVLALEDQLARPLARALAWVRQPRRRRALLAAIIALAGGAITANRFWVLSERPVTDDENVYLFQARILAAGHLTLPSLSDQEPLRERLFEDNIFLVNNGAIFGQYPFGHSVLLIPGLLIGWPHALPAVFALLSVLGMYLLVGRLYGPDWGLLGAALLAISPAFLATSATLLSHTGMLCFLIWFYYFAHRAWKEPAVWPAAMAGLCFLLAFQVRSATCILAAGPIGLGLAIALLSDWRRQWPKILVLGALVGLTLAASFALNYAVNGDIMRTNYHAAWGEGKTPFKHPFGFEKGAWHLIHSPTQGLWNVAHNLLRLNWWLFGWPIGLVFVLAWALRRDKTGPEWLAVAAVATTFLAYFFYFWPGVADTGPVLYYELAAVLIPLTVSGIAAAPRLLLAWMPRDAGVRRVAMFVLFATLAAFASFHHYQARGLHRVAKTVGELDAFLARADVPERAVVFTNYYLKTSSERNFQDSWVVGRPFTSRLLNDRRLFYVNYGRTRDEEFLNRHHPGVPAYVVSWVSDGSASVTRLEDYQVPLLSDNFPDSR